MREAVNRAGSVTEELVRSGVLGKINDSKKREVGESSGTAKGGRFDPKRQKKGKAFAAVGPNEKEYKGPHPLCTRCNLHHPLNVPCGACHLCNRVGHFAKNCTTRGGPGAPLNVAPINARNPQGNRGACYECGSPDHYRNTCPM